MASNELNKVLLSARKELDEKNNELKQISEQDFLTGIANHRFFKATLQQKWELCKKESKQISLLMIDIDFFKQYNDIYGHQKGDDTLKSVANVLAATVKGTQDLAARYGGEEFSMILPFSDTLDASKTAQKICDTIQSQSIEHLGSKVSDYLSVSIGVATVIPSAGTLTDDFIRCADLALYKAKEEGRNRFIIYDGTMQ